MDENTEKDIAKTIDEGKRLIKLVKNYSKMEVIDKGASIISALILIIVVIALATIAVFCLSMALYHWLMSKTNDSILSFSIIALALLFICTLIILLKKSLIESPIIKLLNKIFSSKEDTESQNLVKSKKDIIWQKSSLIGDIKKSGEELKENAKVSLSPKRKTPNGSKFDYNKLATYAIFAYKGIVWTNKIRRFLGKGKGKKSSKRR